jgi:LCP family protein required for cell wall assembly
MIEFGGKSLRKWRKAGILIVLSLAISACNLADLFDISGNPDSVFAFGSANATPTRTPFAPLSPTGTSQNYAGQDDGIVESGSIPTITPTPTLDIPWGDFPGPTRESAIAIPPPMPQIKFPKQVINIILLGSDEAPHRYGHRTDTIMILSLDPDSGKVTLLSIPRDLYVYVPGRSMDRINVADTFGGIEMVQQTILYNFGIEIDHWVRVNFIGFVAAVNHLGGIDVQVEGYLHDECGGIHYDYYPGTYSMDGQTALCYARMRKTSSDFDRLRRQQEVLKAMFQKVLSLDGLTKLPDLYGEYKEWVEGDIGLGDLLPLIPLASNLASGNSSFAGYSIHANLVTNWIMPISGAQVLLPDREKILEYLKEIYTYE